VEQDFFVELVRLARRYEFMVIHDFAYGDICFDGYRAPSFLSAPGAKQVGVETSTMSKGYNMAGWRIGFCAGNREMIRALATIKAYYDYGIFQPIQIAAIIALRHCQDLVERQAATYQRRRDVLVQGLRRLGWQVSTPRAGMFVWAPYPSPWREQMGSIDFAMKLLDEAEVAVSPGRGFGELGEGYVRLALVENEHRLRQAVRQIGRALRLPDLQAQPAPSHLRSICDLTTEEAYRLASRVSPTPLPPLAAVENEDWGRDYLLQILQQLPPDQLVQLGLTLGESDGSGAAG